MTHTRFLKTAAALSAAAAIAASLSTASVAAPASAGSSIALQNAAPSPIVDVRHRHRHRGRYVAGGVVAGLAFGTLLYGPRYGYVEPYPVFEEPVVVYRHRRPLRECFVQTSPYGHGYAAPC